MNVIYIKDSVSKGYLRIGIENGDERYDFTVSEFEYADTGSLLIGDTVTNDTFEILSKFNMKYKARIKALRVLSYGDNSPKSLYFKLVRSGCDASIAEEVVCEMESLGYVNSYRQIKILLLNEVRIHKSGPRKLLAKLISKGYSKSEIEKAINELSRLGEIDFQKSKELIIKEKLPLDASEEQIKKLLYKNGYDVC